MNNSAKEIAEINRLTLIDKYNKIRNRQIITLIALFYIGLLVALSAAFYFADSPMLEGIKEFISTQTSETSEKEEAGLRFLFSLMLFAICFSIGVARDLYPGAKFLLNGGLLLFMTKELIWLRLGGQLQIFDIVFYLSFLGIEIGVTLNYFRYITRKQDTKELLEDLIVYLGHVGLIAFAAFIGLAVIGGLSVIAKAKLPYL